MIRVCILCYKLFWGNSTLCVSFVLFFIFVRVNAQFVKLNAQFARVNAQFVKENAQPDYPMNALLRICKTKRTLLPFKSLPVSVFLYNSPKNLSGDFSAWQQFLTCLYAQITGKDSLREIASGLATNQSRLYHLGLTAVAKSALADAMNRRSSDIFKALFEEILDRVLACAPGHGFKFHNPLHAIDSNKILNCNRRITR